MSQTAPLPPPDLHRRKLVIEELPVGTQLFRFHRLAYPPTYFDTSQGGRFNSPDGRYGVLYAALDRRGAFAETLLRNPGETLLSEEDDIKPRACASYGLARSLRAVHFHSHGLSRMGATANVCACEPYDYPLPQVWSAALHNHPDLPDAILYRSKHDDGALCLAIFDRTADALGTPTIAPNLLAEPWFFDLMDLYGVGLEP